MSAALLLLTYASVLALAGPRLLARGGWTERAPRLGIVAWQSLTASFVVALVLAGLALAVPTLRVSTGLAELLRACFMALQSQYAAPGGPLTALAGAGTALALLGRALWCIGASLTATARSRTRHRETLDLVGAASEGLGAVVIESDRPAVYCLAGRHRRIVVTSGALRLLDDEQLFAALAHERAHLDQRHHLVLAWSGGLARAFPRLRLFRAAHAETRRLVELLADDAATRSCSRLPLAEALLNLAGAQSPAGALGAGGTAAASRVRRLLLPEQPLGRVRAALASTSVAVMLALPLVAVAAPAIATAQQQYCPPGSVAAAAMR